MNSSDAHTPKKRSTVKFAIMSVIGVFLFMVPIPDGQGAFNIPLGYAISWLGGVINSLEVNGFGLIFLLAALLVTVSFLGSVLAYIVKPAFIMNSEKLKGLFCCNIVYFVSKAVGVAVA
ncbi:MAG: hypothetical protein FWB79_07070, partial [Treponema sp.]|nr:hypothetical protein [Treponema sp.]